MIYECDMCRSKDVDCIGEDAVLCCKCYKTTWIRSALLAGIPLSVIEGKTKLTDHFSQDYIDYKCNRSEK